MRGRGSLATMLRVALAAAWLGLGADAAAAAVGELINHQKISDDSGNFDAELLPGDFFGYAVEGIGDLNGDGIPDAVVGAPGTDGLVGENEGTVWILFLKSNGRVHRAEKFSPGVGPLAVPGDQLGSDVGALGDLDGDGHVDIAVGAPFHDGDGAPDRGMVWTLFLDDDGDVSEVERFDGFGSDFDGDLDAGDQFGEAVAGIGDLDGDGHVDMAVGAPGDDDDGRDTGAIWILFMKDDGLVDGYQKVSAESGGFAGQLEDDDFFGSSIAALGDLDGDGVTELAVGAPYDDNGNGDDLGAVWILFMNDDGTVKGEYKLSKKDDHLLANLDELDYFGWDVAAVGDLDGDGVPDLGVGTPGDDDGDSENRGAFYILFLNADGSEKSEVKVSQTSGGFTGNLAPSDNFGNSLAALGDLDGDGTTDLVVGAPQDDDGVGSDNGAVWVTFLDGGVTVVCGDADSNAAVSSTDALIALNAAVGLATCELCACDVNSSGGLSALDAQLVLTAAVGLPADLVCPVCQ